jgi:hypothetical protein
LERRKKSDLVFMDGGILKVSGQQSQPAPRREPSRLGGTGCLFLVAGIVFIVLAGPTAPIGVVLAPVGAAILAYALITGKIATPG